MGVVLDPGQGPQAVLLIVEGEMIAGNWAKCGPAAGSCLKLLCWSMEANIHWPGMGPEVHYRGMLISW